MVLGQHLRVLQSLAGLDQGVPGAGAVVADVAAVHAGVGVDGGGRGQGGEGGLDDRGVLDGAAAPQLHAAEAVLDDREEPVQVRGPLQPVQRLLFGGGVAFGVEDLEEVLGGLRQVRGVEHRGALDQERLGLFAELASTRSLGSCSIARTITSACSGEIVPGGAAPAMVAGAVAGQPVGGAQQP